jgi:signal transduction histidine kinase
MRARAAAAGRVLALGPVAPVTVRGNGGLLREALLELLENACRYGGDSAPVLTEVSNEAGWGTITVANSARTDSLGPSTGRQLGLRIVTWIVEGHGGLLVTEDRNGTYKVRARIPVRKDD